MDNYGNMTFEDLNEQILLLKENSSEELLSWAISKGIYKMELYIWSLAKNYHIEITESDLGTIINLMLDNVSKYFKVCSDTPNLKVYMYFTTRGKFLNYFRDSMNNITMSSIDELSENEDGGKFENHQAFFVDEKNLEEKIMVRDAFSKLKPECQKALYYRKVLEYSIEEIKEKLNMQTVSDTALRKKISMCLEALREIYQTVKVRV